MEISNWIGLVGLLVVVVGGYVHLRVQLERALSERPTWDDLNAQMAKLETALKELQRTLADNREKRELEKRVHAIELEMARRGYLNAEKN